MERRWGASSRKVWVCFATALVSLPAGVAFAQTPLFEEAKTLSTLVEPIERSFDIPQSGTGKYRITLTDLGAQLQTGSAPLAAVQLVVTRGRTVVVQLDGDKDATSPVDTIDFDATPGTYVVHVVGSPGTAAGSGPVGVKIASVPASATVADFAGTLAPPAAVRTDLRTYQIELDVPADGAYEMTLADLAFPHANTLDTASVFMFQTGGSSIAACLNLGATPVPTCPATQTVNLTAGHYELVAGGALAAGQDAGLFSVYIKSVANGTVLHSRAVELGAVKRISDSSFQLDTGSYTLSLKDLAFPAALAESSAIVTRAAQVTALANATLPDGVFTVVADDTAYDVFAYAKADTTPPTGGGAAPGAGTLDVEVKPASGPSALSFITAMGNPSGSPTAYTFPVDITTAGSYRLKFGDFQFPAALGASRIAVVQNAAVIGKTDSSNSSSQTLDATLAAGRATVIVIVKPVLSSGTLTQTGGTFGIEMALATGATQNVLDVTQGVGGLVTVRKLSITTAARYDLTANDLDAPEAFNDLMVVVSRGATKVGTVIVGSGGSNPQGGSATLSDLDLAVGNYSITLIAQPGATLNAATYGLAMVASPPAPTVTLTATPSAVTSGTAAGLAWSSTGATSCTASSSPSGSWSGTKPTSGSDSSSPLTASTTFTLKCTDGNGRTGEKSVTVDIAAQNNAGGGGGGGAFDWLTLVALTLGGAIHFGSRARRRSGEG